MPRAIPNGIALSLVIGTRYGELPRSSTVIAPPRHSVRRGACFCPRRACSPAMLAQHATVREAGNRAGAKRIGARERLGLLNRPGGPCCRPGITPIDRANWERSALQSGGGRGGAGRRGG